MASDDRTRTQLLEELKQAQEQIAALQASATIAGCCQNDETQLNLIADSIPAYVSYLNASNLRYRWVNKQFKQAFGLSRDQIIGSHTREIIGEANYELALPYLEEVRSGKTTSYENVFGTGQDKRWISVNYVPEFGGDGTVTGIFVLSYEITEHKRVEEALRGSEEKWRAITECSPDRILVVGIDGVIRYFNHVVAKKTTRNVIGLNPLDFLSAENRIVAQECFDRVLETGESGAYQVGHCPPGEEPRYFESRVAPLLDEGEVTGFVISASDITERKRKEEERLSLEAQLQHKQKLESLGVLAGGIAHDFNNLLVGILGNADLALHDLPPHSPAYRRINGIAKTARNCAELTNQMLAYSGKGKFMVADINLGSLVDDMKDLLQSCVSKKTTLELSLPDQLPAITADASQIRQVVMNLVINAAEAIGEKPGRITVTAGSATCQRGCCCRDVFPEGKEWPGGPQLVLEVADTGSGLAPETRARIFDPFFTTKHTGRGLGLAAVHGIVRGHKGGIEIDSEPGKGTRFKVFFPALAQPAKTTTHPAKSNDDWRGRGTVLIADDEEIVLEVVAEMCEILGFMVMTAKDGAEAVTVFQQHQAEIVCVILDFKMPRMDGKEAFSKLREIRADIPILLSSGFSEAGASWQLEEKGLSGFIHKPYEFPALKKKLSDLLHH